MSDFQWWHIFIEPQPCFQGHTGTSDIACAQLGELWESTIQISCWGEHDWWLQLLPLIHHHFLAKAQLLLAYSQPVTEETAMSTNVAHSCKTQMPLKGGFGLGTPHWRRQDLLRTVLKSVASASVLLPSLSPSQGSDMHYDLKPPLPLRSPLYPSQTDQ